MALPLWPAALPITPIRDGTQVDSMRPKPLATTMEDGTLRQRRRSTTPLSNLTLRFLMSSEQTAAFLQFITQTLPDGVGRFEMPVWTPAAVAPYPVRVVQIVGGADAVKIQNIGLHYYVTIPLQARDYL